MIKLIHADLYKAFHRMYMYIFMAGMAGIAMLVIFAFANNSSPEYAVTSVAWNFAISNLLVFPLFIMPMFVDITIAEEYKEHTMKNTVSFGESRTKLYLSKLISAVILGLLLAAVTLAVYCGSSLLFLKHDAAFNSAFIQDFFQRVGASCIGYVTAIVIAAFFAVLLKRSSLFIFSYYGIMFLTQYIFRLLKISFLNKYLLQSQFGVFAAGTIPQIQNSIVICLVTLLAFMVLGVISFKKQDIC